MCFHYGISNYIAHVYNSYFLFDFLSIWNRKYTIFYTCRSHIPIVVSYRDIDFYDIRLNVIYLFGKKRRLTDLPVQF